MEKLEIARLEKEKLVELLDLYGRQWLTIDGLWIQAVEEKYGDDVCLEMYTQVQEQMGSRRARRLARFLGIPEGNADLSSMINAHYLLPASRAVGTEYLKISDTEFILSWLNCRPQQARKEKGLPPFPCKRMEFTSLSSFFKSLNPKARVECLFAPPDARPENLPEKVSCQWKVILDRV